MKTINVRAVLSGTVAFLALYCIHLLFLPMLSEALARGDKESWIFGLHQFLGVATCLVSGYVAAVVAGEKGFFYGLGVGVLGTVISGVAAMLWAEVMDAPSPELSRMPFWAMINGFLAAFAGLLATYSDDAAE